MLWTCHHFTRPNLADRYDYEKGIVSTVVLKANGSSWAHNENQSLLSLSIYYPAIPQINDGMVLGTVRHGMS